MWMSCCSTVCAGDEFCSVVLLLHLVNNPLSVLCESVPVLSILFYLSFTNITLSSVLQFYCKSWGWGASVLTSSLLISSSKAFISGVWSVTFLFASKLEFPSICLHCPSAFGCCPLCSLKPLAYSSLSFKIPDLMVPASLACRVLMLALALHIMSFDF